MGNIWCFTNGRKGSSRNTRHLCNINSSRLGLKIIYSNFGTHNAVKWPAARRLIKRLVSKVNQSHISSRLRPKTIIDSFWQPWAVMTDQSRAPQIDLHILRIKRHCKPRRSIARKLNHDAPGLFSRCNTLQPTVHVRVLPQLTKALNTSCKTLELSHNQPH